MTVATKPLVLSADTISGDTVRNPEGEHIGTIKELMIDLNSGRVAYAVLAFGGFLGLGEKYFAVPWKALRIDTTRHCVVLDVPKERLREAPGFDKDSWPDTNSPEFHRDIHAYYGYEPTWIL